MSDQPFDDSRLSVVVPCHKESATIKKTLEDLRGYFPKSEIIVCINGYDLGTINATVSCGHANSIIYIDRADKGCAVRLGMLATTRDIAITVDADLPMTREDIVLVFMATNENDVAIGVRTNRDTELKRRVASSIFSFVARTLYGFSTSDTQCGLKGFSYDAATKLFSSPFCVGGLMYDIEVLLRCRLLGISLSEIPVSWTDKRRHLSMRMAVRDIVRIVLFRFSAQYRYNYIPRI